MLNPMQKDVLTELVNVYVGQAGSLLSEMVNQKVNLSVPQVELIPVLDEAYHYPQIFSPGHIISSSIRFGHSFQGKALMVFPSEEAKNLVNACMGEELNTEEDYEHAYSLQDTDFDVLKEISNVILNAIVGEFGNFVETRLEYSLPEIELIYVSEHEQRILMGNDVYILVLHTSFTLEKAKVEGLILIVLSMNSVSWLIRKIDELLEDMNE